MQPSSGALVCTTLNGDPTRLSPDTRGLRSPSTGGDAVRDLRELLDGYQETMAALAADLGASERDSPDAETGVLEAEREEKLRALGYLD